MALDTNSEIFVMHVAIQELKEIPMHSKKQAQVGVLLFDKASTEVLAEYFDYSNVFLAENVAELPKQIEINDHTIKLEKGK